MFEKNIIDSVANHVCNIGCWRGCASQGGLEEGWTDTKHRQNERGGIWRASKRQKMKEGIVCKKCSTFPRVEDGERTDSSNLKAAAARWLLCCGRICIKVGAKLANIFLDLLPPKFIQRWCIMSLRMNCVGDILKRNRYMALDYIVNTMVNFRTDLFWSPSPFRSPIINPNIR